MLKVTKRCITMVGCLIGVIVFSTIAAGCSSDVSSDRIPQTPGSSLEQAEIINPDLKGVTNVLAACDIEAQESAMLPDFKVGWDLLPLSACYQISLNLDDDLTTYTGKATITYSNLTGEIFDNLVFRLYPNSERVYGGSLAATSAYVDGTQLDPEVFLPDNTGLRLSLNDPISTGETAVIEIEFQGQLVDGLKNSPSTYGIFSFAEAEELVTLANWYPILAVRKNGQWSAEPVVGVGDAVVSEIALYLVEVTAPKKMKIVATGRRIQDSSNSDSAVYRYASGPVRDFTISASPNFVLNQAEVNGVQVNQWGLPSGEQRWEEGLQAAIDSLVVFNDLFGPYPYSEMDVVSVPLQLASGVEYPGLFLIKEALYLLDKEQPYLLSTIISHEVAHQWWYGLVGNDVIEHPWQDEALTTFSSLLYLEEFQPRVYEGTVNYFRQNTADIESMRKNTDIDQPLDSFKNQPAEYSPVVYSKGAMFFLDLRNKIGDRAFFQALQAYFTQNQFRIATPENLLNRFEKACQCDLDDFYNQWGLDGILSE